VVQWLLAPAAAEEWRNHPEWVLLAAVVQAAAVEVPDQQQRRRARPRRRQRRRVRRKRLRPRRKLRRKNRQHVAVPAGQGRNLLRAAERRKPAKVARRN